jgi:hypothetical protein
MTFSLLAAGDVLLLVYSRLKMATALVVIPNTHGSHFQFLMVLQGAWTALESYSI